MKKFLVLVLFAVAGHSLTAQLDETFGLVRKNYYSIVTDPFDTTVYYEQLDSSTIRLGSIDAVFGQVTNLGTPIMGGINLNAGAALNPYNNTYIFQGAQLHSLDLTTGNIVNSVSISNPIQASYFDNFRFNNADTTLYGMARRNTYDPVTQTNAGEIYLAKIDATSGVITQISPNSVAEGYALAGSAIDPHQMVYYFSTGATLMGLDLYSGEIYSNPTILLPAGGTAFDNFAYSCADTTIYGLVRQNFMYEEFDPVLGEWIQVLDSATVRLAKINATTGVVTVISPNSLAFGYSLNGGVTIDPSEMVYYFSTGASLVGVSLITGLPVSNVQYNGQDGQYFDLVRNIDDCKDAQAMRLNNGSLSVNQLGDLAQVELFPNPTDQAVTIRSSGLIQSVRVMDNSGREVSAYFANETNEMKLSVDSLNAGIYWVIVNDAQQMKLCVKD
ncbi:MAG: T9SS type A sorting domain-containing protein [Fluviicola sp.]|nr:T9SS type A sorting domain-containing protein [Fluviicola sp.]